MFLIASARLGRFVSIFCLCAGSVAAADWQASLTKDPPGQFPELRSLRAKYNFGWSGFTAAVGDVHFAKVAEDRFQFEGNGHTTGLARALWKFDVDHRSLADANTLRPVETTQTETAGKKKQLTHLVFSNAGVARSRSDNPGRPNPNKPKQFNLPSLFDLQSAMLYLRSQPLKDHSTYRIVVYPTTAAYLATITVSGREKISVHAGNYNAIQLDLRLNKVGKNLELEPHKKFKQATLWVSDDNDRLIIRAEAQIFVGSVFAELQSLQFDPAKR